MPSPQNAGESMLTLGYSYSVYGERYGGIYTASFRSEARAEALLQRLKTVPPTVRCKPGYPWESVLDPYNFSS